MQVKHPDNCQSIINQSKQDIINVENVLITKKEHESMTNDEEDLIK